MITALETLIPMASVPEHLATRKVIGLASGRIMPHVAGVYRWARLGIRGVKLETALINNRMYTSIEALDRFFAASAGTPIATAKPPTTRGVSKEEARRLIP